MISAEAALELIAARARPLPSEAVALSRAAGRLLAEDVAASCDLPPFENSAMDGYAVRSADVTAPAVLRLSGTLRAGADAPVSVLPGTAVRVLTGAPLPPGADCVVMEERVRAQGERVEVLHACEAGQHVRYRGEDVREGEPLLRRGALLRPYEVALLAAQGLASVRVVRRPRVVVLATGDELVGPGAPLSYGRVRDSNGPALLSALHRWGVDAQDGGRISDDPHALLTAVRRALPSCDLLLVSGGARGSDADFTREAFLAAGLREVFHGVAIKPGKPLLFAAGEESLAFGLPGNPVAALVALEEFVRPALEALQGRSLEHPSYHLRGTAKNAYPAAEGRRQYLFCRAAAEGEGYALEVIRPQGSAMMGMACRANALALSPAGAAVRPGDALAFRWLK